MLTNTTHVVNAVKYTVKTRAVWESFVKDNGITRDDIATTAREIATLAYPNDEPVQKIDGKRTRYGNAVQAAAFNLRSVLPKDETTTETDYLAKVIKAATTAVDHEIDAAKVRDAVNAWAADMLS